MSRCKFSSGKPFEGGSSCLKQTTAGKKSRLLSRSLAFISIFCVLALLFTSLTPVVFADDMVPATGEIQGVEGSQEPNGENVDPPVDLKNPDPPIDPKNPDPPVDPKNPDPPVDPKNPDLPADQNNFGADNNISLAINELKAGDTEISGNIKTEGDLPTYDLFWRSSTKRALKSMRLSFKEIRLLLFALSGR